MTKPSSRSLMIIALLVAALATVPSVAAAKDGKKVKVSLEGPINHPKDPGLTPLTHLCCFPTYTPTIQIELKYRGKSLKSVKLTQFGLWGPCSGFESSDGESKHEIAVKPKKNGSFSGTDTQNGTDTLTVSGQILGKRSASGIVREVEQRPFKEGGYAWGTCDSGVVSWTANRVGALTDSKDLN